MKFAWDKRKNLVNVEKHGLDFADAQRIFEYPLLVNLDNRQDYGEDRWIGIGLLEMRVVVLVFTEPETDLIRIISFRKATSDERKKYEQAFKDGLGED
jgi:uncharacterized DUF497 family protein